MSMTLKELYDVCAMALTKMPPDALVVLAQDENGNSHSPAQFVAVDPNQVCSTEARDAKTKEVVAVEIGFKQWDEALRADGFSEDDVYTSGRPCIVIYPLR